MPVLKGVSSASSSLQVSSFRSPKVEASTPPVLVLYAYQSQCWTALLPTKLHCSSSSQISATSAWATGEEVILRGESFLKYVWLCWSRSSAFWRYRAHRSRYGPYQRFALWLRASALHKYRSAGKHVYITGTESAHVVRYYDHGDKFHLNGIGDNGR